MQKKNIDELFRDKLSDFKQTPDNKVWRAIDASLDKRKKRRVIPIWWSLGGIAAAIMVGLLIFNPFTDKQTTNEILVDTDNESEKNNDIAPNTKIEVLIDSVTKSTNAIVEHSIIGENETKKVEDNISNKYQSSKKGIESTTKTNNTENVSVIAKSKENDKATSSLTNKALVAENISTKSIKKKNVMGSSNDNLNNEKSITISDNITAINAGLKYLDGDNTFAENTITEEIAEDSEADKKSIFEEIKDQEELKKEKVANNRWSAGPNVAPVYFNAIGEGSPVNSIFTPNAKSGNVNMSYGVSVAYAVTKKLTIRSGINKVDYGYDTEDIAFSSSSSLASYNGQLTSIDYAETSNTLTISSKIVPSDKFSTTNSAQDVTAKSATREGYMSQQFGYLELPVELNYALIDKKFGVNLIGGVSSLFLIDNAVSLTSGDLTTEIGEANNINDLNFSANIGLGLNYNFSQKVRFNVEPIFKYQLNTFSDVNGTFRPYSVGVYSGLTFKF